MEDEALADDGGDKYMIVRQSEFYGLGREEWLTLVIKVCSSHDRADDQYCCVLMVKNEEELATEILEHVLWAGLFHNHRSELALRLTIISKVPRDSG